MSSIWITIRAILPYVLLLVTIILIYVTADGQRLFGMTANGGTNSGGVIFEYNISTSNYIK